ncbi:hypothetical protein Q2T83_13965 [Fervidibacter sacchari]|jgi:hypothetical protein|uniref:Uncharacterized protein YxeA n=1 Tax=Candidatus Fervidibacter sacchari TaxID=1448929 RepID=A0ABT2EP29_9BACT|nr:hypothetical protein [Candidatus Fervidibacter sacchari]MCS3919714.1 uncharacterized protein YxeA [Candidatus Fervidibacter sacchari]WKU15428.1 hypothetical protein Q2T83_13965 [Candidatus Fervidibacter sacchari]
MLSREIPLTVAVIVIVVALIIAGVVLWRKTTTGGEIVLEKAAKPYPVPPIFKGKQTGQ